MKKVLFVLLIPLFCLAQKPIAFDSCGIIVELREKYGPSIVDTGTVLMAYDGNFVLTKKESQSSWYPISNYAIQKTRRLK